MYKWFLLGTFLIISFSFAKAQVYLTPIEQEAKKERQLEKEHLKWERNRINSTIIDTEGQVFEGQLLYLND